MSNSFFDFQFHFLYFRMIPQKRLAYIRKYIVAAKGETSNTCNLNSFANISDTSLDGQGTGYIECLENVDFACESD